MSLAECMEKFTEMLTDSEKEGTDEVIKPITRSLSDKKICALSPPGKGLSLGDHGSPIVEKNTLVGIASWATDFELRSSQGLPDIYTDIYTHMPWIKSELKETVVANVAVVYRDSQFAIVLLSICCYLINLTII